MSSGPIWESAKRSVALQMSVDCNVHSYKPECREKVKYLFDKEHSCPKQI